VCRIYDLGNCNGINFLTMELVDGETLADRLARGVLDPELGRSVARQVVAAMAAAHRQGVVHRDLKPGNIMIDDSGHVKVMDFGLARDQNSAPSGRFGPVGTPGYWAPEQSRGESTDTASDVFALGRVLHEILAAESVRPSRRRGMTGLARRYRPLIQRCVARDPRDRFANASQVEAELYRILARRRKNLSRALSLAPGIAGATVALTLAIVASRDSAPTVAAAPPAPVTIEPAPAPAPEPVLVTPLVEAPAPAPRAARQSRRARAASAPVPVKAVEPPAEARPQPVAATPPPPVDADSVQRKLDRLTRQSRSRSLAPETSQAVKRLFSEVHAAYFRDDFARADALLDTIARHLEPR
jgi:hypothetical protein